MLISLFELRNRRRFHHNQADMPHASGGRNKNSLAVVEIQGKQLLIGIGTNSINLVHELDQTDQKHEEKFQKILDQAQ